MAQYGDNEGIDPNRRFLHYIEEGTRELRAFVESNLIRGDVREIDRITKYSLYWKFYEGFHYRDYNETMLSFNYVRAFIDKINQFLLGDSGFTFKVTSYYNDMIDDDIEKTAEELLLYHWRKNNLVRTMYEILQMGSITGDCWVMPTWNEDKNFVQINVLDSRQSYPEFNNGDTTDLKSFMVRQPLDSNYNKNKLKLKVWRWTPEKIEEWYQEDTSADFDKIVKKQATEQKNPLGFIPIVHIKNKPNSASYYGKSDMNDILKINKVFNEMNQELKSIIDYYVMPTTIVTGASTKGLKKGVGKVWSGLPPEANVFNLGLDVDISSLVEYTKFLKTSMHEISDVPENVLGKTQAISGTSAAALKLTYQPLVQQADIKGLTYGEGVTELNAMIVDILRAYDPKNKRLLLLLQNDENFFTDTRIEPVFAYGFPTDVMIELQEAQIKMQLGLASKAQIMNEMGVNNVPDVLAKIKEEKLEDAELQAQIQQIQTPVPPAVENTPK